VSVISTADMEDTECTLCAGHILPFSVLEDVDKKRLLLDSFICNLGLQVRLMDNVMMTVCRECWSLIEGCLSTEVGNRFGELKQIEKRVVESLITQTLDSGSQESGPLIRFEIKF